MQCRAKGGGTTTTCLCVSRESLVLLEPLVPLDTRELVACLVSVVLPDLLESRERRYVNACIQRFASEKSNVSRGEDFFHCRWFFLQGEAGHKGPDGSSGRDGSRVSSPPSSS